MGGAFYQAYLINEKGWGRGQLSQGLVGSIVGTVILGGTQKCCSVWGYSPVLAFSLLYLGTRRDAQGNRVASWWMLAITGCGLLVVVALAVRTAVRIWLQVSPL